MSPNKLVNIVAKIVPNNEIGFRYGNGCQIVEKRIRIKALTYQRVLAEVCNTTKKFGKNAAATRRTL